MIDLHFDLLTKLYTSYLENDYEFIDNFIKNYNKNNVTGVIANLCFMSKEEMKAEYHENYYDESVSVIEMFKVVKKLLEERNINNIDIVMSIEGCDYVDINDLDTESLRKCIGQMLQDVFLFSGSIKSNITFQNFKSKYFIIYF